MAAGVPSIASEESWDFERSSTMTTMLFVAPPDNTSPMEETILPLLSDPRAKTRRIGQRVREESDVLRGL